MHCFQIGIISVTQISFLGFKVLLASGWFASLGLATDLCVLGGER